MTKKDTPKFLGSEKWQQMSDLELVELQLFQPTLYVPMLVFHAALERVLERPIFSTAFAFPEKLREEFRAKYPN